MTLKVVSWNIWIDGYFDKITDFLQQANADIIGLQEVKNDDPDRNVIGFLEELGYQHVFAPVKKMWGNNTYHDGPAIFSRFPIISSQIYLLSKVDTRAAVRADIQVKEKVLHVFSTHLVHDHQKDTKIQKEQGQNLIKEINPHELNLVMGDFNATPESTTVKAMQQVLVDTDSSSQPTWSVYPEGCVVCQPKDISIRLDYIFASKNIKTTSFHVENSQGSDHLPISVVGEV